MTTLQDLEHTAASTFGWTSLREGQKAAMEAVLTGASILCVMPTGSGKSAIYQVPAATLPGVAVVISPLLALQRDQATSINEHFGRTRAHTVNSGLTASERDDAWAAVESRDEATRAKFVFLAPEQLARDDVADRLRKLDVSLVVVDEAHCVSSWGHDFRPDYLRLGRLVQDLGAPVVALTATASRPVQQEIIERLGLANPTVIVEGFDRPNVSLEVVHHADGDDKYIAVLEEVLGLEGPGLVYVATKKAAEALAADLRGHGREADAYHAGRRSKERDAVHEGFLTGTIDVVVATTAFGMGIDKPDVRFVVHADIADSLDSYYQEVGRAGRDGGRARAILHYRQEDLSLRRFFAAKSANRKHLRELFRLLSAQERPVGTKKLRELSGLSARKLAGLLNLLVAANAVSDTAKGYRARNVRVADAVQRAVEEAENREQIDQSRVDMARRYAEVSGCRRRFLLSYFGEDLVDPCANCDRCPETARLLGTGPSTAVRSEPFPVESAVSHPEWGRGTVMGYDDGVVTVLFDTTGYKTLSVDLVERKQLLTIT